MSVEIIFQLVVVNYFNENFHGVACEICVCLLLLILLFKHFFVLMLLLTKRVMNVFTKSITVKSQ